MDSFFNLACRRRSIRRFNGERVSDEDLDYILDSALLAPSSWGGHPVHLVVLRDRDTIRRVAECKAMGAGPLASSDAAIVVAVDTRGLELWIEDAAVASTYILLAAEDRGVGACWIHIRGRAGRRESASDEIRGILGIPDGFEVLNCVALGVKGEGKRAHTRGDLHGENVHRGRFRAGRRGRADRPPHSLTTAKIRTG